MGKLLNIVTPLHKLTKRDYIGRMNDDKIQFMNKKVLILGASGFIGRSLFNYLTPRWAVGTYSKNVFTGGVQFDSLKADITAIIKNPKRFSHAVVLIGEPQPDVCFKNPRQTHILNVENVIQIIEGLRRLNIIPIFFSSEFVFDGRKGNYTESDKPHPILVYGKQKQEVEQYILNNLKQYIIVRLAKTFGDSLSDETLFTRWIADIENDREIIIAQDQRFSPIWVEDVALATSRIISADVFGIYNIAGNRGYSRLELFELFHGEIKKRTSKKIRYKTCLLGDLTLPEPRPIDVSLDSTKIRDHTGVRFSDIRSTCAQILNKYYDK